MAALTNGNGHIHPCENHPRRGAIIRLMVKSTRAHSPGHPVEDELWLCGDCTRNMAANTGIRLVGQT